MKSFRTELENPVVEQDILDLEKKIALFKGGKIDSEKFRSLRLARGVYGQRQEGVQMVRIKLPFGKLTVKQLLKIADVADEYSSGILHATTRQDIQIHFIKLEDTPELWAKLEQSDITLREACGNTVRNVTASPIAGIDPDEPFDVSPYAYETFQYFLRNPICQEMGRKFKIAFSSSDKDTALTFMHDLGFIPKINANNERGFKVLIGGGLGAQGFLAHVAFEFLHEDLIIPFTESVLRVFDKYGERTRRQKARIKYLINDIGLEKFMELVGLEQLALKVKTYKIDRDILPEAQPKKNAEGQTKILPINTKAYTEWLDTNVFEQKQKGFYGVYVKVQLGNLTTSKSRELAAVAEEFAADDIRVTIDQNYLLKFVTKESLPSLFLALEKIGLSESGFGSTADITACPGTDTCNLGISNSTATAVILEKFIRDEYPEFIRNKDLNIKISGCMNSCGQHLIANIGLQGSSLKSGNKVLPSLQLVLGGGTEGNGVGVIAEKVIKVPSKRGIQLLRNLLDDFKNNSNKESFNSYYRRQGKNYFYELLKPLADLTNLSQDDFIDWGHEEVYKTEVGVGECAGVMIDLVSTLIFEADEKLEWAKKAFEGKHYTDSIYHSYSTFVSGAKAMLLGKEIQCNTHHKIITDFQEHFVEKGEYKGLWDFVSHVNRIQKNEPSESFAKKYLEEAEEFLKNITELRNNQAK